MSEVSNKSLTLLAFKEVGPAVEERLVREVMRADRVEWTAAMAIVEDIKRANDRLGLLVHLPHLLGVVVGLLLAFASVPLVFHKEAARWFNARYVTGDEPDWAAVETLFEIGSWSWKFMEPILGTLAFCLLGFQFFRNNMQQVQLKPYMTFVKGLQARRLARLYPRYEREALTEFVEHDQWTALRWLKPKQHRW